MKIKIIIPKYPPRSERDILDHIKRYSYQFPILGAPMVAALTPKDIDVTIINEQVEPIDFKDEVDLVGITSLTNQAPRAYEISDTFREMGVKTVIGGHHASAMPYEASKHADAVCIGEAEDTWKILLDDFKKGKLKKIYQSDKFCSMNNLPFPRVDLLNPKAFDILTCVQTTRGCPYNCKFCAVTKFFGGKFRVRPVEDVIKEVESHINADHSSSASILERFIMFNDDSITGFPEYARKLFKALIPLEIKWASQCDLSFAKDDELLKLAQKSGCRILFIGIDSLSEENLSYINKSCNKVKDYEELIKKINNHNIMIIGSFILGLDYDDEGVFERTLNFVVENEIISANFCILTPLPGTTIYKELEKENRIIDRGWAKYNFSQVVFKPKLMSPEKLLEGYLWVWKEFTNKYAYKNALKYFKEFRVSNRYEKAKMHHIFHY